MLVAVAPHLASWFLAIMRRAAEQEEDERDEQVAY